VIVETIALSRWCEDDAGDAGAAAHASLALNERPRPDRSALGIRPRRDVLILLLGYLYFKIARELRRWVSIGLISCAAVAQCAPAALGHLLEGRHAARRPGGGGGGPAWSRLAVLVLYVAPARFRALEWLPLGLLEHGRVRHRAAPRGARAVRCLGIDQITHAMVLEACWRCRRHVAVSALGARGQAWTAARRLVSSMWFRRPPVAAAERLWRGNRLPAADLFATAGALRPAARAGDLAFATMPRCARRAARKRSAKPKCRRW